MTDNICPVQNYHCMILLRINKNKKYRGECLLVISLLSLKSIDISRPSIAPCDQSNAPRKLETQNCRPHLQSTADFHTADSLVILSDFKNLRTPLASIYHWVRHFQEGAAHHHHHHYISSCGHLGPRRGRHLGLSG